MIFSRTGWSRIFLIKGIYNICLSLILMIWATQLLPILGTPAGNPAYVEMFLLLCLAFGVGYLIVGLDVDSNAGIVVMGILGQVSVFCVVIVQWHSGVVYAWSLPSGIIDFAFAVAFALFLWTYDYPVRAAR